MTKRMLDFVSVEMQDRLGSAFEGIDTTDLDSSFEGLSDEAQGYAYAVLADPSKREAYINAMPKTRPRQTKSCGQLSRGDGQSACTWRVRVRGTWLKAPGERRHERQRHQGPGLHARGN